MLHSRGKRLAAAVSVLSILFTAVACGDDSSDNATSDGLSEVVVAGGASDITEEGVIEFVRDEVAADYGIKIKYQPVDDSNALIEALNNSDDVDAAVLGYKPWIDGLNQSEGWDIAAVVPLYVQYRQLYSKKYQSIDEIPEGATIAYSGGLPLHAAGFWLSLQDLGLITLAQGVEPLTIEEKNITSNPKNLKFVVVDSPVRALDDVDIVASQSTDFSLAGIPDEYQLASIRGKDIWAKQLSVRRNRLGEDKIEKVIAAFEDKRVAEWARTELKGLVSPAGDEH